VSLILLTRPGAHAACLFKPEADSDDPNSRAD
jgi:hypothetical protein